MNIKWHVLVCIKEGSLKGCIVCFTSFFFQVAASVLVTTPFKLQIIKASKMQSSNSISNNGFYNG